MAVGEFAVHYSSFAASTKEPYCSVFPDLDAAEAYACTQVEERPWLRCTIYDHQGRVGAPLRDIRGSECKTEGELSPRFRRWAGSVLFFGGLILFVLDWSVDFRLSWPSLIGVRLFFPGLILLCMEAVVVWHARRARVRSDDRRKT